MIYLGAEAVGRGRRGKLGGIAEKGIYYVKMRKYEPDIRRFIRWHYLWFFIFLDDFKIIYYKYYKDFFKYEDYSL